MFAVSAFSLPSGDMIKLDMNELPQWIISSYGPGKDPPTQLIDNADLSFEEARLLFYTNPQQYVSLADYRDGIREMN